MSTLPSFWSDNQSGLLADARRGDRRAFAEIIQPSADAVYRRARRVTGNSADAEDVCQETMLKAFARLGQFEGHHKNEAEFRAWVARIGANTSIDFLRRRSKAKTQPLEWESENSEGVLVKEFAADGENPEERYAKRELSNLVSRAIVTLEPELRQVCLLRDLLEYSTQEVAERLGISLLAVRLRLYRAHVKLRDKMRQMTSKTKKSAHGAPRRLIQAPRPAFAAIAECCCGD